MENILEFYPEIEKELECRKINLLMNEGTVGEGQVIATLKRYFLIADLIKPEIPSLLEENEILAVF